MPHRLAPNRLEEDDVKLQSTDLINGRADLHQWYQEHMDSMGDSMDKAAKGAAFIDYVFLKAFL